MKSPCVEICRFDRGTGWCIGCGRTSGTMLALTVSSNFRGDKGERYRQITRRMGAAPTGCRRMPA
ncbi:MAG: DUF1289 domain-containing protein [Sphingomonas sp.]